jgi:IclR family pca regulon transcriptional regulator
MASVDASASQRGTGLQSLERGLTVVAAFSREHPRMTLSEVARMTDLSPATARRILLTLEELGFVRCEGRRFSLTPRVLSLGWSYLSSLDLWEIAQPVMQDVAAQAGETCTAATLDLPDIVAVARATPRRILTMNLQVGGRLPAHATAMGRVLLADLPRPELDAFLATAALAPLTERTIREPAALRRELGRVRCQGWALVDEELEIGLRSVAAPVRGADGRVFAALNLCTSSGRVSATEVRERLLPALLDGAQEISAALRRRQEPPVLRLAT